MVKKTREKALSTLLIFDFQLFLTLLDSINCCKAKDSWTFTKINCCGANNQLKKISIKYSSEGSVKDDGFLAPESYAL